VAGELRAKHTVKVVHQMQTSHRLSRLALGLLTVGVLGTAYVSIYYLSAKPFVELGVNRVGWGTFELQPHYELFGFWLDKTFVPTLFHPIHRLDVVLRKSRWVIPEERPDGTRP
jgi:hypothetical protein